MAIVQANDTIKVQFLASLSTKQVKTEIKTLNKEIEIAQGKVNKTTRNGLKATKAAGKAANAESRKAIALAKEKLRVLEGGLGLQKQGNVLVRTSNSLTASGVLNQKKTNAAVGKTIALRKIEERRLAKMVTLSSALSRIESRRISRIATGTTAGALGQVSGGDATTGNTPVSGGRSIQQGLTGAPAKVIALDKAHKSLNKTMMRGIRTQSSFAAKLSTTAQYSVAGAGLFAVATAARAVVEAVIEVDTATRTMSAVLVISVDRAKSLTKELQNLGRQVGGTQKDIFKLAIELGRAGIATEDIVSATESTIRLSRLTGDTFEDASRAVITYRTVFASAGLTVEELGNKLAVMANESRLSVKDIGTVSNFALSAASNIGLTINAVGGLSAAFSNAGVSASTIGTQIRSLSNLFLKNSSASEVFFGKLGLNQQILTRTFRKGGDESDAAFKRFARSVAKLTDAQFEAATVGLRIRDKDVLNKIRQQFDEIARLTDKISKDSEGALASTDLIIQGYAVSWEKALISMQTATEKFTKGGLTVVSDAITEIAFSMDLLRTRAGALDSDFASARNARRGDNLKDLFTGKRGFDNTAFEKSEKLYDDELTAGKELLKIDRTRLTLRSGIFRVTKLLRNESLGEGEVKDLEAEIISFNTALAQTNKLYKEQEVRLEILRKQHVILRLLPQLDTGDRDKVIASLKLEDDAIKKLQIRLEKLQKTKAVGTTRTKDEATGKKKADDGDLSIAGNAGDVVKSLLPADIDVRAALAVIQLKSKADQDTLKFRTRLSGIIRSQTGAKRDELNLLITNSTVSKSILKTEADAIQEISDRAIDYESTSIAITDLAKLRTDLSGKEQANARSVIESTILDLQASQELFKVEKQADALHEQSVGRLLRAGIKSDAQDAKKLGILNRRKNLTATESDKLRGDLVTQKESTRLAQVRLDKEKARVGSKQNLTIAQEAFNVAEGKELETAQRLEEIRIRKIQAIDQEQRQRKVALASFKSPTQRTGLAAQREDLDQKQLQIDAEHQLRLDKINETFKDIQGTEKETAFEREDNLRRIDEENALYEKQNGILRVQQEQLKVGNQLALRSVQLIEGPLTSALTDAAFGIDSWSDAADSFKRSLVQVALQLLVIKPLIDSIVNAGGGGAGGGGFSIGTFIGGLFGGAGAASAHGNVYSGGIPVTAYAHGGVVNGPVLFPQSDGKTGLMGEAGPEAILPLTRIDGDLGVKAQIAGGIGDVTINLVNEAGMPLDIKDFQRQQDDKGNEVISIILKALNYNSDFRKAIRGA